MTVKVDAMVGEIPQTFEYGNPSPERTSEAMPGSALGLMKSAIYLTDLGFSGMAASQVVGKRVTHNELSGRTFDAAASLH
jgi:hypothetical protein